MTRKEKLAVYARVTRVRNSIYVKPDRTDIDIHNLGMLTLIRYQLRQMWFQPKTYTCPIVPDETDPTGEGRAVQFPPELLEEMGWDTGTTLIWEVKDGQVSIREAEADEE